METSPLIWGANQWTGFYPITASVMKGLIMNSLKLQNLVMHPFKTLPRNRKKQAVKRVAWNRCSYKNSLIFFKNTCENVYFLTKLYPVMSLKMNSFIFQRFGLGFSSFFLLLFIVSRTAIFQLNSRKLFQNRKAK